MADDKIYAPCPTCKQYSHSIGADTVTAAFNHFHTMGMHGNKDYPTHDLFDEQTRNAAQLLTNEIISLRIQRDEAMAALRKYGRHYQGCHLHDHGDEYPCTCGFTAALAKLEKV